MKLNPQKKLIYLITRGETNPQTTPETKDFTNVLKLIESAVAAEIDLVQIRERHSTAKALYALTENAARITRESSTRLLVNDRADIAAGAGADGVHLRTNSLTPSVVRRTFGEQFLIGASTHSLSEASMARDQGADFIVLGPVFDTSSKQQYGQPLGLEQLGRVASELSPFPVLALGGINSSNAANCIRVGASGIAAISMLNDPLHLQSVVEEVRSTFDEKD
jgi:thiamine-phosphate pyrophosphorylase